MLKYEEKDESLMIPKGTGIAGFIRAIQEILQLPRLQEVHIDARGKISYKYFSLEGQPQRPIDLNFEDLMPYAVVRNGIIEEILPASDQALIVIGQMFAKAAGDHVYPIAWIGGASTHFWSWYESKMPFASSTHEEFFGLPFYSDRMVEDSTLILSAAFSRRSLFTETQRSYKIVIPRVA